MLNEMANAGRLAHSEVYALQLPPAPDGYDPQGDARLLPAEAEALASILTGPAVAQALQQFTVADSAALRAQAQFGRLNAWEIRAATAAAIIGALFLSPLGDRVDGTLRSAALGLQYAALATSVLCGFRAGRVGPLDRWRAARAAAEDSRTGLFRAVLAPAASAALPWQLGYFTNRLFDAQRQYFERKTRQHRDALAVTANWSWLGLALLVTIGLIGLLGAINWLYARGVPLPPRLLDLARLAQPFDQPRSLLALGVIASALQTVATMRAQVSLSQRNAERFSTVAARFSQMAAIDLPKAQAAATAGDRAGVHEFTDRVMFELDAEAVAWRDVRGIVRPLRKPWQRQSN
jgi:ABC-type multidrug transport system fused ATPase/permease subunit